MDAPFHLSDYHYAHRGLWDGSCIPENSISAFRAAAAESYGIEFDVRPSSDGVPVLFHDQTLARMCGDDVAVETLTATELSTRRLSGTDETIPTFHDLLDIWPTDLPLLTELKIDGATDGPALARETAGKLTAHGGLATLMSFDEPTVAAIPQSVFAGQLIRPRARIVQTAFASKFERAIEGRADYLCVWHADAALVADHARDAGKPLGVYTVRTEAEHVDLATRAGDDIGIIFEHYNPRLAASANSI